MSTTAGNFFADLAEWQQLCRDAVSLAKTGSAQMFANRMATASKQYGLRTYISVPQMRWLCEIADQVPPVLKGGDPAINKVAYVLRATQTRLHHCHWPGCEKQVTPAMWGCITHWRKLPGDLRSRLWREYEPGQEETSKPSAAYIEAAQAIQQWILENVK